MKEYTQQYTQQEEQEELFGNPDNWNDTISTTVTEFDTHDYFEDFFAELDAKTKKTCEVEGFDMSAVKINLQIA